MTTTRREALGALLGAGASVASAARVARSRSIHGPWENDPHNPIVRTVSAGEKWWSRGHATAIEAPDGSWWLVYHGYENGFWTLGRQTLLDPAHWNDVGWLVADGGDLARPQRKPKAGAAQPHGAPLSDDFPGKALAPQWSFYDPGPDEFSRLRFEAGKLVVTGKGSQPRDASPLTFLAGDPGYQFEVQVEVRGDAQRFTMHRYGLERTRAKPANAARVLWLRVTNDRHIVTIHHSLDGRNWVKFDVQMEVSGYHHNVAGDFLSLRPAIFVAGSGEAVFSTLRFQALATP